MCNNKYIFFLFITIILASCSKGVVKDTFNGTSECGFAASVLNVEISADDENVIAVPVYRGTLDASAVQNLKFYYDTTGTGSLADSLWKEYDPSGLFSLSSKRVIFAEDSFTAYAVISFSDINLVLPSKKYVMRLKMTDRDDYKITTTTLSVSRKLTFEKYGDCSYMDWCMFEKAYNTTIYKAKEADIYRVMDPYTEGLIAEEYAVAGLMKNPPAYVQFTVGKDGMIKYEPFYTGMLVPVSETKNCEAYAYYPSDYVWGKDFSKYDKENRQISEKEFHLYPVYCLPDYQHGFLNDGAYLLEIKVL